MTNAKLDILCLSGQDESTNMIKQSDLTILVSELGSKKVEINIIDNINDLTFKNPIFIHDFSDCLNNKKKLQIFISKYIKVKNKYLNIILKPIFKSLRIKDWTKRNPFKK